MILAWILFNFNHYSSLLLPLVLQGIVFTIILISRGWRENRLADKLLGTFIFLMTLLVSNWMLGFADWYDSHDGYTTFMFYFSWSNNFAYGPLIYFYFRSLTNHEFQLGKKEWLHFLPFAMTLCLDIYVFVMDIVVNHWISGTPLPYFHGTRGHYAEYGFGVFDTITYLLSNLMLIGYFSYTTHQYRKYRQYIEAHFSDTDTISFVWLRNVLIAFLMALLVWLVFLAADVVYDIQLDYVQKWYGNFLWGIILYYLSIGGYSTHPNFQVPLKFDPSGTTSITTTFPPPKLHEDPLMHKLELHIRQNEPYLNPQLTLGDLANQLNTTPSAISKTINHGFNQNFNDYINIHRVEAIKKKLAERSHQHLSLLGIALDSGFNSKATFNRAFKKHTQQSPSEFIKSQIHS